MLLCYSYNMKLYKENLNLEEIRETLLDSKNLWYHPSTLLEIELQNALKYVLDAIYKHHLAGLED